MGRPKQLLPVDGKPLLRHVVESLLTAPVSPVVVVLGAHAPAIAPTLTGLPVQIVIHPGWAEGMGSTLRMGVTALAQLEPRLQGLIVSLADQPGLTAGHLEKLLESHHQTGRSIVASTVQGRPVPPVFFSSAWVPRLRDLTGDQGARTLLQAHAAELAHVPLPDSTDLDTPEDYARFTGNIRP